MLMLTCVSWSAGALQETTGQPHSEHEGHLQGLGALVVHPQL